MNSLVRFADRTKAEDGRGIYWGRVEHDGVPFRGNAPPLMSEAEYQERVVRVPEFCNGFFDVSDEGENARFRKVMDAVLAGWYKLIHLDRFWQGGTRHYVEWAEYYMEDGTPAAFRQASPLEVAHGQGYFPGYPANGG